MKTSAIRRLRRKLASDTPCFGLWVTLESPSITEIAVALDLDWVVIDAEHGHLDWKEIVEHLRATVRSDTVVLVRIEELNAGLIKRALDIGADGIVVPWIETAEQLRQAVAFARYPLEGVRGIGAERATCWGQCFVEHTAEANEHVLVVPIIETVRAARQVAQMCQVDGVEVFLFGPADFSSTAGYRGQWEGPGVAEQILQLKETLRRAGKSCGLIATSLDNLRERQEQGFRMIGLGLDVGLLLRSLHGALTVVGRDGPVRAGCHCWLASSALGGCSSGPEVRRKCGEPWQGFVDNLAIRQIPSSTRPSPIGRSSAESSPNRILVNVIDGIRNTASSRSLALPPRATYAVSDLEVSICVSRTAGWHGQRLLEMCGTGENSTGTRLAAQSIRRRIFSQCGTAGNSSI